MSGNSKFGRQPIHALLRERRWPLTTFAIQHGINQDHLRNATLGRIAASRELQDVLPELLGVPIEELFTPESLRAGNHSKIALKPVYR